MSLASHKLPVVVAMALFALMFGAGGVMFEGFMSWQVFLNLLIDNAFVCIVAVGMTVVILSGGIDLSVGSVVALSTMVAAALIEHHAWNPWLVMATVLAMGTLFGAIMGGLIHYFCIPAFIVTLAGMFLARGLCYLISVDSISINDSVFIALSQTRLPAGFGGEVSPSVVITVALVLGALYLAHGTEFGRTVYAIGGNERSALLMGLPVARTKIGIYAFSGFTASLGGLVLSIYMLSGYGLHAVGMELDAIAAVVIGGSLLTGGMGYIAGTVVGVLILGVIQTLIIFDGTLSSWWAKIAIGAMLCLFCVMQKVMELLRFRRPPKESSNVEAIDSPAAAQSRTARAPAVIQKAMT